MNSKKLFPLRQCLPVVLAACILAAGCHKNEPPASPSAAPSKSTEIVSAEKTSFDEVTAKLNKGGNLFIFLSTEQTLRGLTNRLTAASNFVLSLPAVPTEGRDTANRIFQALDGFAVNSGVNEIAGIGMSSIAREPRFYFSKLVVYHEPGQNTGILWSLFGAAPHPLDLDMLPETTALAFFSDFDLQMAWTNVNHLLVGMEIPEATNVLAEAPKQFHKATGLKLDDTLASLGGDYGLIFTLDEHKKITLPIPGHPVEMPSPGLAIILKVNDDVIFNRVDQALTNAPMLAAMLTRVDDPDLKMRTVTVPLPVPIDLRPSIARSGDYLIIASSDTLVRDILAVKSGQKKGYKSTDEFKKLSQGIPDQGNNLALVTSAFSRAVNHVQDQIDTDPARSQAVQSLFDNSTNSFSYSVGVNGADGWEGYANGNHNMQELALPIVAGVGAAAAIAIPNYVKAREAAQHNSNSPTNTP
ncbi:MAG TPA: hypothetical protein VH619_14445 [Verrucomicrobiae bacterium]|nr:hypothetical protein [Verrucomicrobiae bacterium]